MPLDPERYLIGDDGLMVEKVGPWAKDKLEIVGGTSRSQEPQGGSIVRTSQLSLMFSAARADRWSGYRRVRRWQSHHCIQAERTSVERFATIEVSDSSQSTCCGDDSAAKARSPGPHHSWTCDQGDQQNRLFAQPIRPTFRAARSAQSRRPIILNHRAVGKAEAIDILVHVSVSDLQRNTDLYSSEVQAQFDEFAPEWRKHVSLNTNLQSVRASIIEDWSDLVESLGLPRAKHTELIKGTGQQRLYWLMLLSRHPRAHEFWDKITSPAREPTLF